MGFVCLFFPFFLFFDWPGHFKRSSSRSCFLVCFHLWAPILICIVSFFSVDFCYFCIVCRQFVKHTFIFLSMSQPALTNLWVTHETVFDNSCSSFCAVQHHHSIFCREHILIIPRFLHHTLHVPRLLQDVFCTGRYPLSYITHCVVLRLWQDLFCIVILLP